MSTQKIYLEKIQQEITQTPAEYLPALLTIIHSFRESVCINNAATSFSMGWQEVQRGEYEPIDRLWDNLDK
jgi:hypothetical protein